MINFSACLLIVWFQPLIVDNHISTFFSFDFRGVCTFELDNLMRTCPFCTKLGILTQEVIFLQKYFLAWLEGMRNSSLVMILPRLFSGLKIMLNGNFSCCFYPFNQVSCHLATLM